MTVQNLPLANPASVAPTVEQNLAASIGGGVQPGQTEEVVWQSLALSRAVTEDGKGFSVSYVQGMWHLVLRVDVHVLTQFYDRRPSLWPHVWVHVRPHLGDRRKSGGMGRPCRQQRSHRGVVISSSSPCARPLRQVELYTSVRYAMHVISVYVGLMCTASNRWGTSSHGALQIGMQILPREICPQRTSNSREIQQRGTLGHCGRSLNQKETSGRIGAIPTELMSAGEMCHQNKVRLTVHIWQRIRSRR